MMECMQMRDNYLKAAKALKMASGPYKASRDAYVAAGKSSSWNATRV